MKNKIFTLLFAMVASIGTINADIRTGTCGTNLTWSYNTETHVLRISGTGPMTNYEHSPWDDLQYFNPNGISEISVIIDNGVTSIGNAAFENCVIASINIPNSVNSIGNNAFYQCYCLHSITIPNSITHIGKNAFYGCSNLTSVYYNSDVSSWCSIAFADKEANPLYNGCNFYLNGNLLCNLEVPDNITNISAYTFYGCKSLQSVTISDNIMNIEEGAFLKCPNLTLVSLDADAIVNKTFETNSLRGCFGEQVRKYVLGEHITAIGEGAFADCDSLTSVDVPISITSIGRYAFAGCDLMTSFIVPDSVTSIGFMAFDCGRLDSISIGKNVTEIEDRAIIGGLSYVRINSDAILRNTSQSNHLANIFGSYVEEYILGDNITGIGDYAFAHSEWIKSITIPHSVTSIGECAFYNCERLNSINIPDNTISIGEGAFRLCSELASVTIGKGVRTIGKNAFYKCRSLSTIIWNAINCADFNSSGETIFSYCPITSFAFGNEVEHIPAYLCCNQNELTTLIIPNSVTSIGTSAFESCKKLSTTYIGSQVVNIGLRVFSYCSALSTIYNKALIPQNIEGSVFNNVDKSKCRLIVLSESESLYKSADVWKEFFPIEIITTIPTYQVTISADERGSVIPDINGVEFLGGTTMNIKAIPNNWCRFISWSDGNTDANRTLSITQDTILVASFEEITYYTLSVQIEPTEGGIVLFDSNESASMSMIVEDGNTIKLTAVPQNGYTFVHYVDGENIITNIEYNVTMDTSKSITAVFEENPITPPNSLIVPSEEDLENAGYHVEDSVVLCLYFDVAPCYDVYMVGNYRTNNTGGWITDINELKRFEALPGFSGWYAVEIPYTNNAQGKPVQLTSDGIFSWEYQSGDVDAWIYKDGERAGILDGNVGESDIYYYNPGCYIYELAYWKNHNNPCIIVPKHNYTIHLYTPDACEDMIPAVIGSFNNWNNFLQMNESTDLQGRKVYTYTLYGEEGLFFKFADSELGWTNELLYKNQSTGLWSVFDNYVLPQASQDTTLIFDYSDNTKYRFSLCEETIAPENYTHIAIGGLFYDLNVNNGTATVVGLYTPLSVLTVVTTDIVIPSVVTYLGFTYNVTNIGDSAFAGCSYITSITCEAVDPPICGNGVFDGVDKSIPLYVPQEGVTNYQSADQWQDFYNVSTLQDISTGIDKIDISAKTYKLFHNGQILIYRGDRIYTLTGQEVR